MSGGDIGQAFLDHYGDEDFEPAVPTSGLRDPDPAQARYAEELVLRMADPDALDVVEVDRKGRVDLVGYVRPDQLYIVDYHPGGAIVLQPAVVVTKTELDALLRVR